MKYLLFSVCALILVSVEAHLPRLIPQPPFPGGAPLNDAFWTGPNMFRGGMNNVLLPQEMRNSFGQWPQTWRTQNVWNSGVSPLGNERNIITSNTVTSNDPWEQYRKFNTGMNSLSGTNQGPVSGITSNLGPVSGSTSNLGPVGGINSNLGPVGGINSNLGPVGGINSNLGPVGGITSNLGPVGGINSNLGPVGGINSNLGPVNQLTPGFVNNNYPWNTFATQGVNTNIAGVSSGFNQGFVRPQMQSNFNTRLFNNQFQNQGFPNTIQMPNRDFIK